MTAVSLENQLQQWNTNPELAQVILTCTGASLNIASALKQGALADIIGDAGGENVQGEAQKKLDVVANDYLKHSLSACSAVRGLASEEEDNVVGLREEPGYLVLFDPLDGSSNIDINSMTGTIFSVLHSGQSGAVAESEFLQPGSAQSAAGYILYGASTVLALTTDQDVAFFTLDAQSNTFLRHEENVSIDPDTREFAVNMSNQRFWEPSMQGYVADLLAGSDGPRGKNFNMRWVAAMVADVHRILCRGGLFTYPWDSRKPDQAGKLRLMYEANPMGLLVVRAGGRCCTPDGDILDIQPQGIHQRVPVILGAANEVSCCLEYHQGV